MGISPVHQAVSANNLQCLTTLVKRGAQVTTTDKRGLKPIDVAKVSMHGILVNIPVSYPEPMYLLITVLYGWRERQMDFNCSKDLLSHSD